MRPVRNETFVRVLYRLRAEIIREAQDGLEHVDALLRLRGADPEARRVPPKLGHGFGRGKLRMAILRALRDGPRTGKQIAAAVAAAARAQARAAPDCPPAGALAPTRGRSLPVPLRAHPSETVLLPQIGLLMSFARRRPA